jgi:hypothetical protein
MLALSSGNDVPMARELTMKPIRGAAILALLLLCGGVAHAQQRPADTRGQQQQGGGGSDDDSDVLDPLGGGTTPAPVTERPPVRDQTQPGRNQTGTPATNDDDADILDPSRVAGGPPVERPLEDTSRRPTAQVLVPPADEKARLDAAIRDQVGGPAEQYGQELTRVNETMRTNPTDGARVVEGSLSESARDLDDAVRDFDSAWNSSGGATGEVNEVGDAMTGDGTTTGGGRTNTGVVNGGGALSSEEDGWGDPIPVDGTTAPADERMSWWQKLTLTLLDAVHHGVKQLANNRANELKLRAELVALDTEARYRPYVDFESRRAIENSAFARGGAGYDTRLNDLMLGNNRPLTATPSGTSGATTTNTTAARGGGIDRTNPLNTGIPTTPIKVTRLPRVRDPISGVERVVIDMPLGVDPVRPIR